MAVCEGSVFVVFLGKEQIPTGKSLKMFPTGTAFPSPPAGR